LAGFGAGGKSSVTSGASPALATSVRVDETFRRYVPAAPLSFTTTTPYQSAAGAVKGVK
jgi:hypothetical protein